MNYVRLTKTKAREITKRSQAYGYFRPIIPGAPYHVTCSACQQKVEVWPAINYRPTSRDFDVALMRHLLAPEDDERCPYVLSVRAGSEIE